LGLHAVQIQPFEPTTAEYPGAEDSASDMGLATSRSYKRQESYAIAKMTAQCAL